MQSLKRAGLACVLTMIICASAVLLAQQFQGSFTGTVTDPSGAAVPGVTLTATETDQGYSRSVVTKDDGSFEILLLPPGNYRWTASKSGFEKTSQAPWPLR